jgi:Zn-dependent protease
MGQFAIDLSQLARQVGWTPREPTEEDYEQFLRQNPQVLTSGRESTDLLLGIGLIAFVFGFRPLLNGTQTWQFVLVLTAVISPAFIFHELAHKYLAIHYGKYARFTLLRQMTFFTLIAGILGIPLAGPGATMILGRSKDNESGIFAAGGPLTNFILASLSLGIAFILPESIFIDSLNNSLVWVFYLSAYINSVLGVFNLLPFGALDGKKILGWNGLVWIGLVALNLLMAIYSFPLFNSGTF